MRFATKEEQESIDNFIKSISKPTGINFFEQNDNYNCEKCKYPLSNPLCGILGSIQKPCGRKMEKSEEEE